VSDNQLRVPCKFFFTTSSSGYFPNAFEVIHPICVVLLSLENDLVWVQVFYVLEQR
jgi:hypothetical protein